MDIKEFLNNVCKEIKYKPASEPILDELEVHLDEIKNENICKGLTKEESEKIAVEQMGDAKRIGKILNKIHRPKLDWITLILMITLILVGGGYTKLLYPDVFIGKGFASLNDVITNKIEYIVYILVIIFSIGLYFYDYRKIYKHSKLFYLFATALNIIAYMRGFRTGGNLIRGLWPFTAVSPTVFSVPLYIVSFAGFFKDINIERKINITISSQREIYPNLIKICMLSVFSVIVSLMINFVSGFLLTTVYVIILTRELLNRKQIKSTIIFLVVAILSFSLLSTIICILPTKWKQDELLSAYWVGIDTEGERNIDIERNEIFKSAKLLGQADLKETYFDGYSTQIQNYFGTTGKFSFLGILARYGWIASMGLVALLLLFNIKLFISAAKIKDIYGKLITIGIASLYFVQTVCNLAMNLGIIGVAEFNLPLISVGDAEFLMNILCMALILSAYRRKDINFEEPKKSKWVEKVENIFFEEC